MPMRMEQACCRWSSAAVADYDESQVLLGVWYAIMYLKAIQHSDNLDLFLNMTQLCSNMLGGYVFIRLYGLQY
jgi:hypothetical protein